LLLAQPKIISLKADLQKVNERLPAAVYVPFLSSKHFLKLIDSIRNFVVLNIVFNESRVFSTKQRAPFYICLEIFRPEEEKPVNLFAKVPFEFSRVDTRLSDPRTLRNELSRISDL
jgi:phosphatidylinositol 4-kinase